MSNPGPDLKGAALEEQRFHMLRSIAEELSGDVTFPTSFDIVVRLRKALQNPEQTLDHIAMLLSNEPLIRKNRSWSTPRDVTSQNIKGRI